VIIDAGEDVGEPGLRIDAVELGGLCRTASYAEDLGKAAAPDQEPPTLHAPPYTLRFCGDLQINRMSINGRL
jgi:hypothetical protein